MAESIKEIRKRKAREMLTAMAIDDKEKQKELHIGMIVYILLLIQNHLMH